MAGPAKEDMRFSRERDGLQKAGSRFQEHKGGEKEGGAHTDLAPPPLVMAERPLAEHGPKQDKAILA